MSDLIEKHKVTFEGIKHTDESGIEFWYARELCQALEYASWQKFVPVVNKATKACVSLGIDVNDHFNHLVKMIEIGKGGQREIEDIKLDRYACYLIVQNGDPSKPIIAAGQTYFAIQTRRQELSDEERFSELSDDQKRLYLRHELREHNKQLSAAAHDAGVVDAKDYAIFQNYGYKGLYGGLGAKEIHERKGLKKSQKILDHMGHTELAANLFRATQTEEKLKRDNIKGKDNANYTHYSVGQAVRETIRTLGGTMPEDLPTPTKSIQQLESEAKKQKKLK